MTQSSPGMDALAALRGLQEVREAQPMPGGYWLPTPTRCVSLGKHRLIVSALPRGEIVRRWGITPQVAGICRVIESSPADIPTQTFDSWLGAPVDTKRWAERIFDDARTSLQAANLPLGELELYCRVERNSAPAWVSGKRAISSIGIDQLVLCRPIGDATLPSRFIGRSLAARLTHQARIRPADQRRLLWGVRAMMGYQAKPRIVEHDGRVVFELPEDLPNEEFRLIRALGSYRRIGRDITRFEFRADYVPLVRGVLSRLGLDI
jgi:hypothetical protein